MDGCCWSDPATAKSFLQVRFLSTLYTLLTLKTYVGDSKIIMNEGMPHGSYQTRGDLIIQFRVKFPESNELPPQTRDYLRVLLPSPLHSFDFSDVPGLHHVKLFDMPPSNFDSAEVPGHTPFDPFGIYQNDSKMNFESTSEH